MTLNEKIGARIRELRVKNGLTGEELGDKLGVTKTQVSSIEKGKSRLNTDHLSVLTDIFDVSSSYIMCEEIKELAIIEQLRVKVQQLESVVDYFRGGDAGMGKLQAA